MAARQVRAGAPQTFDALLALIQERFETLSPSHKRIAERVMADPETVAFMTISDLAAAVKVNEATATRFATSLGLKGFPSLVALCQERLREQAQLLRRFENLEQMEGSVRVNSASFDQANITRTFARIEGSTWDSAVRSLGDSRHVHVMGLRKSYAPAYLFGYLLGMLREGVTLITGARGGLADDIRHIREGDCFVAISIYRYVTDTLRAAELARARGAHVIALTDNPGSPLVRIAQDVFFLDAASPSVMRSVTAFTALVQALCADVAQRMGRSARENLLMEEDLLSGLGVYIHPPE